MRARVYVAWSGQLWIGKSCRKNLIAGVSPGMEYARGGRVSLIAIRDSNKFARRTRDDYPGARCYLKLSGIRGIEENSGKKKQANVQSRASFTDDRSIRRPWKTRSASEDDSKMYSDVTKRGVLVRKVRLNSFITYRANNNSQVIGPRAAPPSTAVSFFAPCLPGAAFPRV